MLVRFLYFLLFHHCLIMSLPLYESNMGVGNRIGWAISCSRSFFFFKPTNSNQTNIISAWIQFIYPATLWYTFLLVNDFFFLKVFSSINLTNLLSSKFYPSTWYSLVLLSLHFYLVCHHKDRFFFEEFFLELQNQIHDPFHLFPILDAFES